MEHPEEHYYKLNRFFLTLSGLWPYQNARNALILRIIIIVFTLSCLLPQVTSILTSEITTDYLIEALQGFIPIIGSLVHMYLRVIHLDKLKKMFDRMRSDWSLQKSDNEVKIMHDYARTSKFMSFYFTIQVYSSWVSYIIYLYHPDILDVISPMNESRPRKQYFKLQYFVPEEQYISLIRFHIILSLTFASIVFVVNLTLFVTVAQHVCGMCELLGYVGLIKHVHTIPFLFDLLGILLMLSIVLMQISTISGNTERAIRSITFGYVQILYVALFNYIGQQVIDKSSGIYDKVYNGAWYDAITAQQKLLLLIIKRRAQPLMLTACNFYVISLPNLGRIFQTSLSYCMFIRQIKGQPEHMQ